MNSYGGILNSITEHPFPYSGSIQTSVHKIRLVGKYNGVSNEKQANAYGSTATDSSFTAPGHRQRYYDSSDGTYKFYFEGHHDRISYQYQQYCEYGCRLS